MTDEMVLFFIQFMMQVIRDMINEYDCQTMLTKIDTDWFQRFCEIIDDYNKECESSCDDQREQVKDNTMHAFVHSPEYPYFVQIRTKLDSIKTSRKQISMLLNCLKSIDGVFRNMSDESNMIPYGTYVSNNCQPLFVSSGQKDVLDNLSPDMRLVYLVCTHIDGTGGLSNGINQLVSSYVGIY